MVNQTSSAPAANGAALSEEAKAALLERWRRILNGEIEPEVISIPAEVEQVVQARIAWMPHHPGPRAESQMRLEHYLERYHSTEAVLRMDVPAGHAVIAAGDEEVALFCDHFPHQVSDRVRRDVPPRVLSIPRSDADVPAAPMSLEARAALVERWRGILAGTIQPEVISFPPKVDRIVEGEIKRRGGGFSKATVARMRLDQWIGDFYPTETVLTMNTPEGPTVIAVGDEQVGLFYRNFRDEVEVRVETHWPAMS